MSLTKNILVAFLLAILYLLFSAFVFYLGITDSIIATLISIPAIIVWGAGFGGGNDAASGAVLAVFLVIWIVFFFLVLIVSGILKATSNN